MEDGSSSRWTYLNGGSELIKMDLFEWRIGAHQDGLISMKEVMVLLSI